MAIYQFHSYMPVMSFSTVTLVWGISFKITFYKSRIFICSNYHLLFLLSLKSLKTRTHSVFLFWHRLKVFIRTIFIFFTMINMHRSVEKSWDPLWPVPPHPTPQPPKKECIISWPYLTKFQAYRIVIFAFQCQQGYLFNLLKSTLVYEDITSLPIFASLVILILPFFTFWMTSP